MKFGMIVLQVNTHRLIESDFRFDVTTTNCCRLVSEDEASAGTYAAASIGS